MDILKDWRPRQKKLNTMLKERDVCFTEVLEQFYMPVWLQTHADLSALFSTGVVPNRLEYIDFGSALESYADNSPAAIFINYSGVTKNALIKYIEDYWGQISEGISKLPKVPNYHLSLRDRQIVDLRREGKKFKEIADIISEDFPEKDSNCDEYNMKTAYRRAEKLISSVFHRKAGQVK